jgi:hypothetical protein
MEKDGGCLASSFQRRHPPASCTPVCSIPRSGTAGLPAELLFLETSLNLHLLKYDSSLVSCVCDMYNYPMLSFYLLIHRWKYNDDDNVEQQLDEGAKLLGVPP